MGDDNPFLIPPPPAGTPVVKATAPPPEVIEFSGPPMATDSGTRKMPTPFTPPPVLLEPPVAPPLAPPVAPVVEPALEVVPAPDVPVGETPVPASVPETVTPIVLVAPGGLRIPVEGPTLLGRNPTAQAEWPDAGLVPLADRSKTVSKTHAALHSEGAEWRIVDLHSTNGTSIRRTGADPLTLEPETPTPLAGGDELWLGEFRLVVTA